MDRATGNHLERDENPERDSSSGSPFVGPVWSRPLGELDWAPFQLPGGGVMEIGLPARFLRTPLGQEADGTSIDLPAHYSLRAQPAGRSYTVEAEVMTLYGRIVCTRLTFTPREMPGRVTGADLRDIAVDKLLERSVPLAAFRVREAGVQEFVVDADRPLTEQREATSGLAAAYRSRARKGRDAITREFLTEVVDVYRTTTALKQRDPTAEVGRRFNKSRSTAARWIGMARADGLLGKTRRGAKWAQHQDRPQPEGGN